MSHGKRPSARDYAQQIGGGARCPNCGKVRFLTKAAAKRAIRRMRGRDGRMQAYRCGEFWHLGHPPRELIAGHIPRDQIKPRRPA